MPLIPGTVDTLTTLAAPTIVQNAFGTGAAISYQVVAINADGHQLGFGA